MNRIPPGLLRRLRNEIEIPAVIEHLGIPTSCRGQRSTFRCPDCGTCNGTVSPYQNLARCFHCQRNFNPIDLVMAERGFSFLEAVEYLEGLLFPP